MDVVKTNIERIGGAVEVVSQKGRGTTVRIKIPLTLAIIPGLVVMSAGQRFVVPQVSLQELIRLEGSGIAKGIERIGSSPVRRRRGRLLPRVYMNHALGLAASEPSDAMNVVVLQEVLHAEHQEDIPPGTKLRALVADDSVVIRRLVSHALSEVPDNRSGWLGSGWDDRADENPSTESARSDARY